MKLSLASAVLGAVTLLCAWGVIERHPRIGFQPLREVAPYSIERACPTGSSDPSSVYGLTVPGGWASTYGLETNDIERLARHLARVEERRAAQGERCEARLRFDRGFGPEERRLGSAP